MRRKKLIEIEQLFHFVLHRRASPKLAAGTWKQKFRSKLLTGEAAHEGPVDGSIDQAWVILE